MSKLTFLTFSLFHDGDGQPTQREVDRKTLANIAPDREDMLLSDISTDELRSKLSLRSGSSHANWLNQYFHEQETKLPKGNVRTSVLFGITSGSENGTVHQSLDLTTRRRVLSASSSSRSEGAAIMGTITNRLVTDHNGNVYDVWQSGPLSTTDKLISPRPLGPTHLLAVVPQEGASGRKAIYSETLQIPVNDLLFTLNAPNLQTGLPVRLFKELCRVAIKVPHIDSFKAVVVYVHTLNQAELMRAILPEWIRDVMYAVTISKLVQVPEPQVWERKKPRFFGMLSLAASNSTLESLPALMQDAEDERDVDTAAKEIAKAALDMGVDEVVKAAAMLNGVRDNLHLIGFYGYSLWAELDHAKNVLIRALHIASLSMDD